MWELLVKTCLAQGDADTAAAEPSRLPAYLMVAGFALLIIVLMGNLKKKSRQKRKVPYLEPKERVQVIREKAETPASFDRRSVEAAGLVRELTALIDNRSDKIEILIRHADERIARLERLADEAEQRLTPRHTQSRTPSSTNQPESSLANDALRQQIYDLADQGHASNDIAQRLGQHAGKVELILALRRA